MLVTIFVKLSIMQLKENNYICFFLSCHSPSQVGFLCLQGHIQQELNLGVFVLVAAIIFILL